MAGQKANRENRIVRVRTCKRDLLAAAHCPKGHNKAGLGHCEARCQVLHPALQYGCLGSLLLPSRCVSQNAGRRWSSCDLHSNVEWQSCTGVLIHHATTPTLIVMLTSGALGKGDMQEADQHCD